MQNSKVAQHIVSWLRDYATNNHLKGFVVGISGGIDSALTSTLCAQTNLPVYCITMPIHQAEAQVNRAQEHINWLTHNFTNVTSKQVDLSLSFDTLAQSFSSTKNEKNTALALANTRARLRMTTLYYFAGLNGYAVAGTGNKVEDFGIGFYTKYGDGGVDISPIADLFKTEVYELAAFLHVPTSLLNARPTDGLFGDNRSDEEQIGATYPELEWAMQQADAGKKLTDFTGREYEVFKIYLNRNRANQHKWKPIPVCTIPATLK